MPVFIHAIARALPPTIYPQTAIRDMMKAQPDLDRLGQRLTSMVYNGSGIDQRHSAIDEFLLGQDQPAGLFFDPASSRMLNPSTRARNEVYTREAAKLFVQAAQAALSASGLASADITHVITVSCTGFFCAGSRLRGSARPRVEVRRSTLPRRVYGLLRGVSGSENGKGVLRS